MSGISSSVGLFSGIDSAKLIDQLLAIEARPRDLANLRIQQLQIQQSGYLDLNSKFIALRSAASGFRTSSTFDNKVATSTDDKVLTATATSSAVQGSYKLIVDRLVSSQQQLSRGFVNRDSAGLGLTSITLESTRARLDRDVSLSDLNDGQGISRGKFVITDSGSRSATIDISRAVTVNDVLDAINGNGVAQVTASVEGGKLVVKDNASSTTAPSIADLATSTTAASLGLTTASSASGGTRTGAAIFRLNSNTTLQSFNDGNGVSMQNAVGTGASSFSVKITRAGTPTTVAVNVGDVWKDVLQADGSTTVLTKTEGAVTTVSGVLKRMNDAFTAAGFTDVTASVDATNGRLRIVDASGGTIEVAENGDTTAKDLGLLTAAPTTGTLNGRRVFAGLNTTLATSLNGGNGIGGDGDVSFTLRNGAQFTTSIDAAASLSEIMRQIEADSGSRVRVTLNSKGTGLSVTDLTSGSGNLIVTGTTGADTAASLGISTGATGVASNTIGGTNLQRQYVSRATSLSDLPIGKALGTGVFRITDTNSVSASIDIGTDSLTVGDIIDEINSKDINVKARINSNGDGIELYEQIAVGGSAGAAKIKVEDSSGNVAKSLNLVGTASGTGASNTINGSYERTITLSAADTLDTVVTKVNEAKAGVQAAVIRDGSGATPFRLSLASTSTGSAGRFIIDTGATDLGLQTLDVGQDSRVFYGSDDPARAIAVTSSTNSIDTLIPGLRLDLKSAKPDETQTITVNGDDDGILSSVKGFVTAFNTLSGRIEDLTKYDIDAQKGGVLLGDGTALEIRAALYRTVQGRALNVSGRFSTFADVGITVGKGGDLNFDESKFRAAMTEDRDSVQQLFTARTQVDNSVRTVDEGITVRVSNPTAEFSSLGLMGQMEQLGNRYLDSTNGTLILRQRSMDTQVKLQRDRVAAFTAKLDSKRSILQNQFATMEQTLAKLQSQQNALGSIKK